MEFQILDVDYVLLDEKPVIRIFGKDEKGGTVCAFYEGFSPYFYAEGKNVPKLLEKSGEVKGIETVEKRKIGSFAPQEMYRVVTKNPAKTPELREYLISKGAVPYEADILFKYRFMNDLGLAGLGWVKVEAGNQVATNTVMAKKKIQIKSISPVEREDDAPLRCMAFDIECVPLKEGTMPEAKKDPIILISCVFSTPYRGKSSLVLGTRSGKGVTAFS